MYNIYIRRTSVFIDRKDKVGDSNPEKATYATSISRSTDGIVTQESRIIYCHSLLSVSSEKGIETMDLN